MNGGGGEFLGVVIDATSDDDSVVELHFLAASKNQNRSTEAMQNGNQGKGLCLKLLQNV